MSRIEFRDVEKRYAADSIAIQGADLVIEHGEFCVFVGPSGCGKSTLLRIVAGLEDITAGDLFMDGQRVNDVPPAKRGVAMVFQSYALYPHMTVRENMAFGLKVFGAKAADIQAKVVEAAHILQLTHLMDRLPKALSGGQRQRVAIGRAIVKQPKVFLFDEPLSNLDAALRVQTRLEIANLHQRLKQSSMVYVTHDQVEAMTLADKIVLLHDSERIIRHGSIAQVGSPLTLYHRPKSIFVAEFIGSPKMNMLPATLSAADATQAQLRCLGQPFTAAVNASGLSAGEAVQLGVRPEHVQLASEPSSNTLNGHVIHLEKLGESTLIYLNVGANYPMITIKVEGTPALHKNQHLFVHLPAHDLHVFDSQEQALYRTVNLSST